MWCLWWQWYSAWFLPLLVVSPRASALLLTVLLPLYYLRFAFSDAEIVGYFDYGVVWIEFVPVYALMLWEFVKGKEGQRLRLQKLQS